VIIAVEQISKVEKVKRAAFLLSILVFVSAVFFGGCGESRKTAELSISGAPGTKAILIRMTTPVPPGDELSKMCQEGMAKFNARTTGAYHMQMFPGGQLANMSESLDAIRTGAVEGGVIPPAAFTGTAPELGLAELPFLYNNGEANAYVLTGLNDIYSNILQEKANQKSLGCIYTGSLNLLSTKKPLKTLEDLKSLIVGCDNPSSARLVAALKGSGIVVDFTEDYSNLQKGIMDAKTSAPQYMLIAKLYEVARYYTVFHGLGSLYSITINSDIYGAMPRDTRDILDEEMGSLARKISQYYVEQFYSLTHDLEAKGVQYYYLPAAERDRWKNLVYPGTLAALETYGDVGSKIKRMADAANAEYPYKEIKNQPR
jgi:TRAP-type C4-dicarboxylate transport system substrate-binding protein